MKLRFFVVGQDGRLCKVSRAAVQDLWAGELEADALGSLARHELRLVTVLCDRKLQPRKIYLLRLPLTDGRFTEVSYFTLRAFARPDCVTPGELVAHSTEGWPADFFPQLAVALDVPVASLNVPVAVGGPLFLAAALQIGPWETLRYLR